jgi:CheY-like chemotaxis protein
VCDIVSTAISRHRGIGGTMHAVMSFRVLLVEPDPGLAEEVTQAFGPVGFTVTSLGSGEQAVERCREEKPDLILLAAELPDMSGFSVCNRLKRAVSGVPLLLYTAEATDAAIDAHRATRTRADDYLKKPFELAELLGRAAALLHADGPSAPPPPPPAPPAAPRLDGKRPQAQPPQQPAPQQPQPPAKHLDPDGPPMLQRVSSGQVASKGLANAMAAAARPPPEKKPAQAAQKPPQRPPAKAPATPPPAAAPPQENDESAPPLEDAGPASPPPVPPAIPFAPPPAAAKPKALAKLKIAGARPDPTEILAEWPRDPSPPKGTPDEKVEFFRERLRARDTFFAKVRDALAQLKGQMAELGGERDGLEESLLAERDRADELAHKLQEAGQDAAAQAAQLAELRKKLDENETTRQSLSEVLNETMQQHEVSDQAWSARVAAAEEARARVEAELTDARDAHSKAVAALEADRADERARLEGARAEAEASAQTALSHMEEQRQADRAIAEARLEAAQKRIEEVGAERDQIEAERARLAAALEEREQATAELEARAREEKNELRAEADGLRTQLEDSEARLALTVGERDEAAARAAALEAEVAHGGDARKQLEEMLKHSRAETRAYEEKALAAEHAHQARTAELESAETRIGDLTRALEEGRATAEGTRGELARVESGRAEADRRTAEAVASRDQLARELESMRRNGEAERDRLKRLEGEVQRLAKLEPAAEEAARLKKEVASLREMVQQRTQAAESASRAAQAAAAERAKMEEKSAIEGGRIQGSLTRLEADLGVARRRLQEVESERNSRTAELARAKAELDRANHEVARLSAASDARQKAASAEAGDLEQRHQAEVTRLKAAMVDLEKHLEARARSEMAAKKRVQELERAVAAKPAAAADPAEVARFKVALEKLKEEVEELKGENDFLNGEVARYVQKNKDLAAQIQSLKEA